MASGRGKRLTSKYSISGVFALFLLSCSWHLILPQEPAKFVLHVSRKGDKAVGCSLPRATAVITTYLPERHANLPVQANVLLENCFIAEVLVWNNNPGFHIQADSPFVTVSNSRTNIGTDAKYTACLMASSPACYIIDDDWLPLHVETLYRLFLMTQGDQAVVLTDGVTQYMDVSMSYSDDIRKHFGFAWLGVGSFISKNDASRFMLQQHHLIPQRFRQHSDIFFSIFANKLPLVLSANIQPLGANDSPKKMSGGDGYERFLDEARKVAFKTVMEHEKHFVNDWQDTRVVEAKAICKDTGLVVLDNGGLTQTFVSHSPVTPEEFVSVDSEEHMYAAQYPYYAVCDEMKETAFVPRGDLNIGRHFGLLFMGTRSINTFELFFSLKAMSFDFSMFDIELRDVQGVWNIAQTVSQSCRNEGNNGSEKKFRVVYITSAVACTGVRLSLTQEFRSGVLKFYKLYPHFSDTSVSKSASKMMEQKVYHGSKDSLSTYRSKVCKEKSTLILVVTSAATATKRRNAIRSTIWRQAESLDVAVVFALTETTDADIVLEAERHQDIIMLRVLESYDTLSLKTLELIRWVWFNCNHVRFFMKTDDDSYVQLGLLLDKVSTITDKHTYMGYIFYNQEVYRDPGEKNYEPHYDGKVYPPYASGSGYILSMSLVHHIANSHEAGQPTWKLTRNEDAAVGLWLAGLNISQVHDETFWPEPPAECRSDASLIHRQSIEEFYSYYSNFLSFGDICGRVS